MERRQSGLLLAGVLAALASLISPREAAAQWTDMECRASQLVVAGLTCRKGRTDHGVNNRCFYQNYSALGVRNELYAESYLFTVTLLKDNCHIFLVQPNRFEQMVRDYGWVKRNGGDNFAPLRVLAGGYAVNFTADGGKRKCIAFYQQGPYRGQGLASNHWGFVCGMIDRAFDDAQLVEYLKSVTILEYPP